MKKLLIAAAVAVTFSGVAFANNNDTGAVDVQGSIIDTLTVRDATITMPDLVKPDGAFSETDTTATLACDQNGAGTVSYTNAGNPFANGDATNNSVEANSANAANTLQFNPTGSCGDSRVTGEGGAAYSISVDTTAATPNSGVTLSGVSCLSQSSNSATSGVIKTSSGDDHIWCGATVTADSTAWIGYSITGAEITVTYD